MAVNEIKEFASEVGFDVFAEWWVKPYNIPFSLFCGLCVLRCVVRCEVGFGMEVTAF